MAGIIEFLNAINSLSPIAVIALLGTIIFLLVKGKTATDEKLEVIKGNDLHELPEIAETLRRIEAKLTREFGYIRGRLDG